MKKSAGPVSFLSVFFFSLILLPAAAPRDAFAETPQQLVRQVVQNELHADDTDHSRWMYRDAYKSPDKNTVKLVVETGEGNPYMLIQMNGHALTAQQHQADLNRMQQMANDPAQRQREKKNEQHDNQQARDMMNMLPNAFIWREVRRENGKIYLSYRPNPYFSPGSMSAKVLAAMSGMMVVNQEQLRLESLTGRLDKPVQFAWGLFGHLNAGGTFQVIRTEVGPGIWQITQTHVHISGHALFFKTIGDQEDEVSDNYHRVPDSIDLRKAVDMLREGKVARQMGIEVAFR